MNRTVRLGAYWQPLEDRITPAAGDLDSGFGVGGKALAGFGGGAIANATAIQQDGKIVVAGSTPGTRGTDFGIARLNANGSLDTTFGAGGRTTVPFDLAGSTGPNNDDPFAVAVQGDGKILVAGRAVTNSGFFSFSSSLAAVTRLNADGSVDTSFGNNGRQTFPFTFSSTINEAKALAIQSDGKIVVVGRGQFGGSDYDFGVARLNTDGSLDATFAGGGAFSHFFDLGGGFEDDAEAVVVQGDGRIVVAGRAQVGAGNFDFAAVRFLADGTIDSTFWSSTTGDNRAFPGEAVISLNQGVSDSGGANAVGVTVGGRIVLAGSTTTSGTGGQDFAAIRLNTDGTLDASFGKNGRTTVGFNLGATNADVAHALIAQPDGKVLLAGSAQRSAASADFAIARLNVDGSVDTSYGSFGKVAVTTGSGSSGARAAALQISDGSVVLVGGTGTDMAAVRLLGDPPATTTETVEVPPTNPPPPPPKGPRRFAPADIPAGEPILVGGRADGTARVLDNRAGGYQARAVLTFFPGESVDVRTAVGDVNGDGVPDYIGGTGPGVPNEVAVIDGATGARLGGWRPFEDSFTGGVFVTAADLNGDGQAEVIVTPDQGGGPVVAIFNGGGGEVLRFLGIADPSFRGGARAAVGDVNGDGHPDLIVSAGFQGGARIAVYDGSDLAAGSALPRQLVPDFFAFESSLRNGAFVSAGDVDGDGFADLAFGGGPGGAARVRVVSGRRLLAAGPLGSLDDAPGVQLANFFAGDDGSRGGVRVTLRDADADGRADLTVGSGEGEASQVRVYKSGSLLRGRGDADQALDPFAETLASGVYVG